MNALLIPADSSSPVPRSFDQDRLEEYVVRRYDRGRVFLDKKERRA